MLCDVNDLATLLNLTYSSLPQVEQARLTLVAGAADAAVRSYLRRGRARNVFPRWPESGSDTAYLNGNNRRELVLPYRPVTAIASVYVDYSGYAGKGSNPFAASTLLAEGTDFLLDYDDGTQSGSGKLIRLAGPSAGGTAGDYGWYPAGGYGVGGSQWPTGTLAGGRTGPVWLYSPGSIKITYTAGFTTVPDDLTLAALQFAAQLKRVSPLGGVGLQAEHLADYQYTVAAQQLNTAPELGTLRQLLARYRVPALG